MTVHATNRRHLLKGAAMLTALPVASIAGVPVFDVVGGPVPVPAETPVLRLFRQWVAWMERANVRDLTDEAYEALCPERDRIEAALEAAEATDLRDLAAKVLVLSGEGSWAIPDRLVLDCARIAGRDAAKLPRCLFKDRAA